MNKQKSENNRVWYLDAAKGIGIILISYGHLGVFYEPVMLWDNMFKVTIFWVVIGFLLSGKNLQEIELRMNKPALNTRCGEFSGHVL